MIGNWFTNIKFAYPWVLALLFILVWLIFWYIKKSTRKTAALSVSSAKNIDGQRSLKPLLYHSLFVLRSLAIIVLILALARPQKKLSQEYIDGKGIDIILCNDISASMEALDFEPNRMEAAKQVAKEFVRKRQGDRVGLTIFGAYPLSICPLTTDTGAIITQLNTIKIGEYDAGKTLIGSGLATCINRLKDSKTKSKIIVLLSDGVLDEDFIPIDTVIALAKRFDIKIYTIGIGTKGEVPVLHTIRNGTKIINQSIIQRDFGFNEDLLQDVANKTGGRYFYSKDGKALSVAYDAINTLEKSDIKTMKQNVYEDKFLPLIYIGFLFLLIEMVLRYSIFKKFP